MENSIQELIKLIHIKKQELINLVDENDSALARFFARIYFPSEKSILLDDYISKSNLSDEEIKELKNIMGIDDISQDEHDAFQRYRQIINEISEIVDKIVDIEKSK